MLSHSAISCMMKLDGEAGARGQGPAGPRSPIPQGSAMGQPAAKAPVEGSVKQCAISPTQGHLADGPRPIQREGHAGGLEGLVPDAPHFAEPAPGTGARQMRLEDGLHCLPGQPLET